MSDTSPPSSSAPYVACLGELMWDLHTMPGASFERDLRLHGTCAGAAANVACALSEVGLGAAVLGQLADDALGRALRAQLASRGVDVSALMMAAGRCGLVLIEHQGGGGMRCVAYPPRRERLQEGLRLPANGRCAALHIGALETDRHVLAAHTSLARDLRSAAVWVTVDLNARPRMWRDRRLGDAERQLLAQAHIVKASAADLAVLGLADEPSQLDRTRDALGCYHATLLVTRAEHSTSASGPWGNLRRTAKPATVNNPVGAGDAFCAGVLSELRNHDPTATLGRARILDLIEFGHVWAQRHIERPPPGSH